MVGNFLGCLFVLFILFGLLCNLTGDENKGMQIINNCVTAIVIYSMIIVIFSAKNSEIIKLNIPFWNGIVKYGTLKSYLKASAGGFALDFIQLVTLVLLINWVSNITGKHMIGAYGNIESEYFWNLNYVSGKHAVIEVTNTEVYVTDNNSRNFTYINGNRLFPNNKNILVDGDELTLADQKFEVSICR